MTADQSSEAAGDSTLDRPSLLRLAGWERWHDVVRGIIMVALTVTVLAVLLRHADPAALAAAAGRLPAGTWIVALLIAVAFPLISSTRWWVMARALGAPQPWSLLLRACLGIAPVNLVSPSKSGDLLRVLALRGRMEGSRVFAGLLVERALDMAVLAAFALAGGLLSGQPAFAGLSLAVFVAVFLAVATALSGARIPAGAALAAKLAAFSAALRDGFRSPLPLATAAALTGLHWTLVGVLVTAMLAGSGANVLPVDTMTAMPMAILVGMIPVTIAGMGTREGTMLVLFAEVALPSQILAAGLLYTVLVYWLPALAGLAFTRSILRFERADPASGRLDPSSMQA